MQNNIMRNITNGSTNDLKIEKIIQDSKVKLESSIKNKTLGSFDIQTWPGSRPFENKSKNILLTSPWLSKNFINLPVSEWDTYLVEWLTGFIDAEGMFLIDNIIHSTGRIQTRLLFQIKLHVDHKDLIEWFLHNIFGKGSIRIEKDRISLRITDMLTIEERIIPIFNIFKLNTKKSLDFEDWKLGYYLIKNNDHKTIEGQNQIIKLKNRMNSKRIDFNLPEDHKIVITPYWLLGFTEGDGSFLSDNNKNTGRPVFDLTQKNSNQLLESIKSYLNCGDNYINNENVCHFKITQIDHLYNNIYLYFKNLTFFTSKGLDFYYWSYLVRFHYKGLHTNEEVKSEIKKLLSNMNAKRLSTNILKNKITPLDIDQDKLEILLNLPALSTEESRKNKAKGIIDSKIIYVYDENYNLLNKYPSIRKASIALNIPKTSLIIKLDTNKLCMSYYFFTTLLDY